MRFSRHPVRPWPRERFESGDSNAPPCHLQAARDFNLYEAKIKNHHIRAQAKHRKTPTRLSRTCLTFGHLQRLSAGKRVREEKTAPERSRRLQRCVLLLTKVLGKELAESCCDGAALIRFPERSDDEAGSY